MILADMLGQAGGLQSLARDLGVSEEQAATGFRPPRMAGSSASAPGGAGAGGMLGSLTAMLDANGDGNPLDDILHAVGKGA
jgi:hypothetical protein